MNCGLRAASRYPSSTDSRSTISKPSRNRIRNDCVVTNTGAPTPASVIARSASSSMPRSTTISSRISLDRSPVLDRGPDRRELELGLDGQAVVGDAQRGLDELEVREVTRLRLREGLLGVARLDQRQRLVDRRARLVQEADRFAARHALSSDWLCRHERARQHDQQSQGAEDETPHLDQPGWAARYAAAVSDIFAVAAAIAAASWSAPASRKLSSASSLAR